MTTLSDVLDDFDFRDDFLEPLIDNGWLEFLFPFLLIYAIVITILNNVPMFEDRKPVKVIISLVIALFAIAFPLTDDGITMGEFMAELFPGVTAFTIGILALYIVAAMMGVDLMKFFGDSKKDPWIKYVLGAVGVLVVVYYYAKGFGYDGFEGSELEEFFTDPLLYILVVFGLVFFLISKDDPVYEKIRERAKEIRKDNPEIGYNEATKKAKEELKLI
jgi:uncharacterized membrane protein YfcA